MGKKRDSFYSSDSTPEQNYKAAKEYFKDVKTTSSQMITEFNERNKNVEVMLSSNKMDWQTPAVLFDKLNKMYGPFDLDAAASEKNAKCEQYYCEGDDSLSLSWNKYAYNVLVYEGMPPLPPPPIIKNVFLNPPYGRSIGKWMEKAAEEAKKGCTVVCLIPSRTGSVWFQNAVSNATEVLFLKGRVTFEIAPGQPVLDKKGKPMAAPFDSAVIVFKPEKWVDYEQAEITWWNWKK
jgi:phage N-6-adenine-methyltransferase